MGYIYDAKVQQTPSINSTFQQFQVLSRGFRFHLVLQHPEGCRQTEGRRRSVPSLRRRIPPERWNKRCLQNPDQLLLVQTPGLGLPCSLFNHI